MNLALIGFGDLGRYIEDALDELGGFDRTKTAYFDDNLHRSGAPNSFPFRQYAGDAFGDHHFYVCLGYKHLTTRNEIISRLAGLGRKIPNFVHPDACVHRSARIGMGAFVYSGCTIDRNSNIGRGACLINAVTVAHDCAVGDCCWLSPGVTLSGNVTIGHNTFFGSGSAVSNNVRVGSDVIVGLATAVTKDIDDGQSAIGNPMRILRKPLALV